MLFYLVLAALALPAPAAEPFFFIQAADTQFGMFASNRGFEQETANFEFLVATANRLKPAFLIVCGDLVNRPGDPAQAAEYSRIAARLDRSIRLYNVAGNHDVGNQPTPALLAIYRERFGPDWYSFRAGDLFAVVLNSGLIHSPQKAPQEYAKQEAWLRGELEKAGKNGARHRVVFQHHPLFILDPGEPDVYFNIPLERRRKYLGLFGEYGVSHVFAGHHHANNVGKAGPIEMVTTGPVGKPLGKDGSGFRVVIVRDTGIEHRYYEFGWAPDRIDLAPEKSR
ncbi:MAG: metallophosphoesterase [Acidobacteriota bacterium]